jgi:hypothetical protein
LRRAVLGRRGDCSPKEAVSRAVKMRTEAWEEAVRSLGIEPAPRGRPNAIQWIWYAFWGPLPERYRTWVLYDATCSTWVFRHLARILTVAVLPVAAVALFLPAPLYLRLLTAFVAGGGAILFTAVWLYESTDYRLSRAGWRWGIGEEVRQRRSMISKWMVNVRRL